MPDATSFDDVNEAVEAEWREETTPFERVRTVVARTYGPATAADLADEALTSPKTARKHLESLAESGFVATENGPNGATCYRRSPESLVTEQASDLLADLGTAELATRVAELRETVADYRERFGAESPADLAVAQGTVEGPGASDDRPDPEAVREWQTVRRNLAFANAALALGRARDVADDTLIEG